jgi:DNA primase catalytic core
MPLIDANFCDKVKDQADMLEVIKDFVELEKSGSNWKGMSPFSDEKTGSFMVSVSKGIWKCYSSGIGGNSAVSFLMKAQKKTYPEAIEYLAAKMNLPVEYTDSKEAKVYMERKSQELELLPVLKAASAKYHEEFLIGKSDMHTAARKEIDRRGYSSDVIDTYQIGFAPGNKFLYNLMSASGKVAQGVQLALINEKNNDRYWNRVIFPIHDASGEIIGLAGRDLTGEKKAAKWINSSETLLYNKSKVWYALHLAKTSIASSGTAYIVEGYNDVVSFRESGIKNTISPCGTSISETQIKILKRYCSKVVLALDPDAPGTKSLIKHIPLFLKHGFSVFHVYHELDLDPDDLSRALSGGICDVPTKSQFKNLYEFLEFHTSDAFKFLIDHHVSGNEIEKMAGAKKLASVIADIDEDFITETYTAWVQKESGVKSTTLKGWIKDAQDAKIKVSWEYIGKYQFPDGVKESDELVKDADRYQIIQANNQVYARIGDEEPYKFKSVSNFKITIIQHMNDEKFPSKLLSITNIFNKEVIFDVHSDTINSPQNFDNIVTAQGNFLFKGNRSDLNKLRHYLFDKMGSGRKIEVLGQQPENFWVWNNRVLVPGKEKFEIASNGVFRVKDVSYYVPSANEVYKNNPYKFTPQKRFVAENTEMDFLTYTSLMCKVHRQHAIPSLLFTVASFYIDQIVPVAKFFPLLFFYGPASTGKDMLAECCQSFFGTPQNAINLEGGNSTFTAQIRKTAQFANCITHLSEYKRGDQKLDGTLKGFWDRRGKEIGNIESRVATDETPVLSSILITGNEYPDSDALITRMIWNEMTLSVFTAEQDKAYQDLADCNHKGVSGFSDQFISLRPIIGAEFKKQFRTFKETLKQRVLDVNGRMVNNMSVLGGVYMCLRDHVQFPFTLAELVDNFVKILENQERKRNANSLMARWWDCFLQSMRGNRNDQLRIHEDFTVEDGRIFFNFTNAYSRVQRQWYVQFKDVAPGKSTMRDELRKCPSYIEDLKSKRLDSGRDAVNTSVIVMFLDGIDIGQEIMNQIQFQLNESSREGVANIFPAFPATHQGKLDLKENTKKSDENEDDLPF